MLSRASRDENLAGSEIQQVVAAYMTTTEARMAVEQFADRFSPSSIQHREPSVGGG
jgi:hypothetical protein